MKISTHILLASIAIALTPSCSFERQYTPSAVVERGPDGKMHKYVKYTGHYVSTDQPTGEVQNDFLDSNGKGGSGIGALITLR